MVAFFVSFPALIKISKHLNITETQCQSNSRADKQLAETNTESQVSVSWEHKNQKLKCYKKYFKEQQKYIVTSITNLAGRKKSM